jgi:hypothetical protein
MTAHHMPTLTPAEMLAAMTALVRDLPAPEVYDGPTPDEAQMTPREMDRRAGWHYPEGP